MAGAWPWLAVAGLGALHGLNPAAGWMFAAMRGVRTGDRAQALRALLPIAAGHATSVAIVASVVALGLGVDRVVLQAIAGVLLVMIALRHVAHRLAKRTYRPAGQGGLALWSFMVSTGHGTGLMLVPALIPVCMGDGPARAITASGSLTLALAAVALHTASMLAASGLAATAACHVFRTRGLGIVIATAGHAHPPPLERSRAGHGRVGG